MAWVIAMVKYLRVGVNTRLLWCSAGSRNTQNVGAHKLYDVAVEVEEALWCAVKQSRRRRLRRGRTRAAQLGQLLRRRLSKCVEPACVGWLRENAYPRLWCA
eukprot:1549005-Pleurochrysis_carterae.AAC.3